MTYAVWILRNAAGVVRAASVAEYTRPETLQEWKDEGGAPELVIGPVTLNRPLPPDTQIIQVAVTEPRP